MSRQLLRLLGTATLTASALFLGASTSALGHSGGGHGGGGHGGGGHAGGGHAGGGHAGYAGHGGHPGYADHHGGPYHGGYYHNYHHGYYGGFPAYGYGGFFPGYGYGFYRPYYGYGLGGLGVGGLGGYGLGGYGLGGYGLGGYGLGGYGSYAPYYGGYGAAAPVVGMTPPNAYANQPVVPPTAPNQPPPDNAAHLRLLVPDNAEVLFEGEKTTQSGPAREFVSPPVPAGKVWTYTISVRYTDPNGKPIDDTRRINVRANDWFSIDFTRPAPPERAPAPQPQP